jgi:hypothetical protein
MKLSLLVPVALLLALPLVGPGPALGQIASPGNAGGNSGNNSSGTSSSTLSTPSFSIIPVSTEPDVSVSRDGSVSATATTVEAVNQSVAAAIENQASTISALVTATGPDSSAGDAISSQLVVSGAPQADVDALVSSLQGLANQSTLTALSDSINAFNSIVNAASPEALSNLAADPDFAAISSLLREARAAL